jgi:hypothetical protein
MVTGKTPAEFVANFGSRRGFFAYRPGKTSEPFVKKTLSAIGYKSFPFYIYYFSIAVSLATIHII